MSDRNFLTSADNLDKETTAGELSTIMTKTMTIIMDIIMTKFIVH